MLTPTVVFSVLSADDTATITDEVAEHCLLYFACIQAAQYYRQQQRVLLLAETQQQAEQLDELLWSFEPDSFVAHSIGNENQGRAKSPVEIHWLLPKQRFNVLINLTPTIPSSAAQFQQIIDIVPLDETRKQLARERFKQYRAQQFNLDTQTVSISSFKQLVNKK
jgi:DNA polymerase-3 subunit chi